MTQLNEKEIRAKMQPALDHLKGDLNTLRTGGANPAILDRIVVEMYGSKVALKEVATVSASQGSLLIQPFDRTALKEINKAIFEANLGLTPQDDGKVIRLKIPPLSEERRKDLAKQCKGFAEKAKVGLRNARRDLNEAVKKSEMREDEKKRVEDTIQKCTDSCIKEVDKICDEKEKEIMKI